jgi:hypothetical protein
MITPLKDATISDHKSFIDPAKHELFTSTLVPETVTDPNTGEQIQQEVASSDFLRMRVYPSDEVGMLALQDNGVIEMQMIKSTEERKAAQMFLFPNWAAISKGDEFLPTTVRELRDYFLERKAAAPNQYFRTIAEAAISSCDLFKAWGTERISQENTLLEEAKAKGVVRSYSAEAELLFEQLELVRRDDLIQATVEGQRAAQGANDEAIAKLVEVSSNMMALLQVQQQQKDAGAIPSESTTLAEMEALKAELDAANAELKALKEEGDAGVAPDVDAEVEEEDEAVISEEDVEKLNDVEESDEEVAEDAD